jgi:hypothetical protein
VDNGSSVNYVWAFADWTDSRDRRCRAGGRLLRGINFDIDLHRHDRHVLLLLVDIEEKPVPKLKQTHTHTHNEASMRLKVYMSFQEETGFGV